jgi:hypothetical protein
MGILTIVKFFLWVLTFFVSLIYDFPNYGSNEYLYNYYVGQNGWGMWLGVDDYYDWIDLELEAFNIGGQAIAYPMYLIGLAAWREAVEPLDEEMEVETLETEEL